MRPSSRSEPNFGRFMLVSSTYGLWPRVAVGSLVHGFARYAKRTSAHVDLVQGTVLPQKLASNDSSIEQTCRIRCRPGHGLPLRLSFCHLSSVIRRRTALVETRISS